MAAELCVCGHADHAHADDGACAKCRHPHCYTSVDGPTVAPFDHDPARTDHTRPDDLPNGHRFPCFACWCYACGARTDGPRNERDGDAHPGDPDHRWCYE